MRKLFLLLILACPVAAEEALQPTQPAFSGLYVYPRGYRSSDGVVFDIVDATNGALRVNCVAGTGCTGTGSVDGDAAAAAFYGGELNRRVATTTPYAYAFPPTPLLQPTPPAFNGVFGYLRGYTDAAGVFGILDSTNAAVRINCVAGCAAPGITIGSTTVTGGATTQVLFNLGGVVSSDADFTFATDTLTVTKIAGTTFTGNTIVTSAAGTGMALFFGTGFNAAVNLNTSFTPDSLVIGLPSTSNTLTLMEEADRSAGFDAQNCDAATAAATDPGLCIMSHNQDTAEWVSLRHDGGSGTLKAGNSTAKSFESRFGRTVTLTEAGAAETVITIVNATTETFSLDLYYHVTVTDGTNRATRHGYVGLVCDNAAGTMTCTKDATAETDDGLGGTGSILIATGGATLTYAIAANVATANTAILTFDINSSLATNACSITWRADLLGKGTIQ